MIIDVTLVPTVDAGLDSIICSTESYTLKGSSNVTVVWTTSGTGTFDDSTKEDAVYTPSPADIADGQVQLTLTTTATGDCENISDVMTLTIWRQATVYAGVDAAICGNGTYQVLDAAATEYASVEWTLIGSSAGSLSGANTLTPVYTAGDEGRDTLILTVQPLNGVCEVVVDSMIIDVTLVPTVSAGEDAVICSTETYTLDGSSNVTGIWTSNGTGTFGNDSTNLKATYTPSAADIADGQVQLTLTTTATGDCENISDVMTLTIWRQATVYAGVDAAICGNGTYQVLDAAATEYASVEWTLIGSSAGSLSGANTLTPVYTAGDEGRDTLILTVQPLSGVCESVSDTMIIEVTLVPTVSAGEDAVICSTETYTLDGSSNVTGIWTSNGTGTFGNDSTNLKATYTPSAADIADGQVQLTLTTTATGDCENISDVMTLTIWRQATVYAGVDAAICGNGTYQVLDAAATDYASVEWTLIGSSAGSLSGANTLTPVYTAGDEGRDTLILTVQPLSGVCESVSDTMIIDVTLVPTVDAGLDSIICSTESYTLKGSSNVTVVWTTSGTGTFDDSTKEDAVYTPSSADIADGQVQLTLTTTATGDCENISDVMTLTIWRQATVYAGVDAAICGNGTYQVLDAAATEYASVEWTLIGSSAGSLSGANTLTPVYTAGDEGRDTLILTVQPLNGVCEVVVDSMIIDVTLVPTVSAGEDAVICSTETYTLDGSSNVTGIWTSNGTGTFGNDSTNLKATYTPSAADIADGQVQLTLTTTATGDCENISDVMTLTIWRQATVYAGVDAAICGNGTYQVLDAAATEYASVEWTLIGSSAGSLSGANTLTPVYTAGDEGRDTLILTVQTIEWSL